MLPLTRAAPDIGRRSVLWGGLVSTLTALTPGNARARQESGQTFVMVHGAWHGGWCRQRVAEVLRGRGHDVYTPTLTGLGERSHLLGQSIDLNTHVKDVRAVLEYEDLHDVVLVGHSYGGFVVTAVAALAPELLSRIIYLDAFLPDPGQSFLDMIGVERIETIAKGGAVARMLTVAELGIEDSEDAKWVASRLTPQPANKFATSLDYDLRPLERIEQTFVQSSPLFADQATRARGRGMRMHNMGNAGHNVMVTQPEHLADILEAAGS